MSSPVTFLLTAYNAMPLLPVAVRSMQEQTFRDFKAIIVNDGSRDGTAAYLDSIEDPRFEIIHQENQGQVVALNAGAARVTTPYIARLDADDIALPLRLEKQLAFMDAHPEVGALGTRAGYIAGADRFASFGVGKWRIELTYAPKMATPPFWNPATDRHTLVHPSVLLRTTALKAVNGYRNLIPSQDIDLWLRLHDAGFRVASLDEMLTLYRISVSGVGSTIYSRQIQNSDFAWHTHEARLRGEPELSHEEYLQRFPVPPDAAKDHQVRLLLRNAMGHLLAGQVFKGGAQLAKVALSHPGLLLSKIRDRVR